jgi:hypothetical protein
MSTTDPSALDGNAAAGAFTALFGTDVTTAVIICAHCGREDVFARHVAYVQGPGIILRCPGCTDVVARLVQTPDSTWLTLSGSTSWRLPV